MAFKLTLSLADRLSAYARAYHHGELDRSRYMDAVNTAIVDFEIAI